MPSFKLKETMSLVKKRVTSAEEVALWRCLRRRVIRRPPPCYSRCGFDCRLGAAGNISNFPATNSEEDLPPLQFPTHYRLTTQASSRRLVMPGGSGAHLQEEDHERRDRSSSAKTAHITTTKAQPARRGLMLWHVRESIMSPAVSLCCLPRAAAFAQRAGQWALLPTFPA